VSAPVDFDRVSGVSPLVGTFRLVYVRVTIKTETGAWWLGKLTLPDVMGRRTMSLEQAAEAYLNEEIKTEPDKVGPPVQVLRFTSDGSSWIKNSGICPANPR